MRHNMGIGNTVSSMTLDLTRFFINRHFQAQAMPKLSLSLKLRRPHPPVNVVDPTVLNVKRVNHTRAKKPVVGTCHKLGVRPNSV